MKMYFSILLILLLIIGLFPQSVYAEQFDIPTGEEAPYYMKFLITYEKSKTISTKEVYTAYGYFFSDYQDIDISYTSGKIIFQAREPNETTLSLRKYINGVEVNSTTYTKDLYTGIVFSSDEVFTDLELQTMFQSGFIETYNDQYSNHLNYELVILENNMNIYEKDTTNLIMASDHFDPGLELDPLGHISFEYDDINITNSSVNVTVKYLYQPRQYYYTSRDWDFDLDSDNGTVQVISHQGISSYWSSLGYSEGYLIYKISGLPIGTTEINAYLHTSDGQLMYSDVGFIHRTQFVDADGDGYDDITGMPMDGTGTPDIIEDNILDMPDRSDYDTGIIGSINYSLDMLMYYITLPFKWIAQAIGSLAEWLANSIGWIENISSFFNAIFGFLPQEFTALIYIMVLITVIFSMFKLMRG